MDSTSNSNIDPFDKINENINNLNDIFNIIFGIDFFKPAPTLLLELSKRLIDLDLKLLQFGLLIDSIPKTEIDKLIKNEYSSTELNNFYLKKGCRIVDDIDQIAYYSEIFHIPLGQQPYFVEIRKPNTIDSVEFLLKKRLPKLSDDIIPNLRKLRSCRNISTYAHKIDSKKIDNKLKEFGFSHPLIGNDINRFWDRFLKLFSDTLSQLISDLQSYRTDVDNNKILIFKVEFEKSQIQYGEKNRIIFKFSNKADKIILIKKYKIDSFFKGELIRQGGWGNYGNKIEPKKDFSHSWGEVDPTKYYGYNKKGNWNIKTKIEFVLADEDYPRTIENECFLLIK